MPFPHKPPRHSPSHQLCAQLKKKNSDADPDLCKSGTEVTQVLRQTSRPAVISSSPDGTVEILVALRTFDASTCFSVHSLYTSLTDMSLFGPWTLAREGILSCMRSIFRGHITTCSDFVTPAVVYRYHFRRLKIATGGDYKKPANVTQPGAKGNRNKRKI